MGVSGVAMPGKGAGSGEGHGEGKGGCSCCDCWGTDCQAPDPATCPRMPTDILFLIGFIVFWIGMIVCASMGFSKGDIDRLFYFVDYNGNRCGDGALADYKYTHWTHWANQATNICVRECPDINVKFKLEANYIGGTGNSS